MNKIIEVLRLKYVGGLSHAQIGQVCGISKCAVTKYISLAAGHMQQLLKTELLILDDWGMQKITASQRQEPLSRIPYSTGFCTGRTTPRELRWVRSEKASCREAA